MNEEDKARLSPLIHEHINTQGRHSFVMPEAVEVVNREEDEETDDEDDKEDPDWWKE